ncbi:related to dienelactone hydrolase and related enzymes [Fusarium torulosum]|uniref:Related to dienelactone hydrolase and related enzymes n=1 Tax=Fusarium torulosum TaxID=33205 RepID=A0AAE8M4A9_9HYPO|nr:related to dienelactone hydrolase and related enzymes [Fusarium torulosum]
MFEDITQPPKPLPTPQLKVVRPGISLLPPLSRRGHGPGLVVLTPTSEDVLEIKDGVPSVLIKWAEEGYTVVQIESSVFEDTSSQSVIAEALEALTQCDKCDEGRIGLVVYAPDLWNTVASCLIGVSDIVAAVLYVDQANQSELSSIDIPLLQHIVGSATKRSTNKALGVEYFYPKAQSHAFATPFNEHFDYNMESVSHTRNLQFLKPKVGGPYFDLEHIWEEHTHYEFADRSVEHTMSTMVQEPYVNHIPTLTGGIGREKLSDFYRHNFIFNNSADSELDLISRTVGIDRVVDEFIFKFTHDQEVPWMLPGVPPTNIKAEVPFTAVVNIRGDRLYHEHISWDQGTLLRQLDLLPEYLPFPYALPDGRTADAGFEYRVPVTGKETAVKMRDRHGVESNQMFAYEVRERQT